MYVVRILGMIEKSTWELLFKCRMLLVFCLFLGLALMAYISVRSFKTNYRFEEDKGIKQVYYSQRDRRDEEFEQEDWDTLRRNLWRMPELYLSIVVPAFNEENRILKTLSSMVNYMEERSRHDSSFRYEIILVNDGGKDGTLMISEEFWERRVAKQGVFGGRLRLISSVENKGKGNAVRLGVMASLGEYILMVDADGATEIECFSRVEDTISSKNGQLHIVFGSRSAGDSLHSSDADSGDSKIQRSWYRQALNIAFHKITKVIINSSLNDTQCGFKMFSRASARMIFPSLHIKRWAFDIEIVIIAQILSLEIMPVSVDWKEIQGSKLSVVSDSIKMLIDILILKSFYILGFWRVKEEGEDRISTQIYRKVS